MELIFHVKCTLKCHLQFVLIRTSLKFCRLVMIECTVCIPGLENFSPRISFSHHDSTHSSPVRDHLFDDGYAGKQPVVDNSNEE